MNPVTIFFYIRSIIASLLSNLGLSQALAVSLANFSLAAIGIVLLLIYPQIVVLVLIVLFIFFGLKH
jgi:hypothetical protein